MCSVNVPLPICIAIYLAIMVSSQTVCPPNSGSMEICLTAVVNATCCWCPEDLFIEAIEGLEPVPRCMDPESEGIASECGLICTLPPTTAMPTTSVPTTNNPTTSVPTTSIPTTINPTTVSPTTNNPTRVPTTKNPTTNNPTTKSPTTNNPTRVPTTSIPTTSIPTTSIPTTSIP
eukprot:468559_1